MSRFRNRRYVNTKCSAKLSSVDRTSFYGFVTIAWRWARNSVIIGPIDTDVVKSIIPKRGVASPLFAKFLPKLSRFRRIIRKLCRQEVRNSFGFLSRSDALIVFVRKNSHQKRANHQGRHRQTKMKIMISLLLFLHLGRTSRSRDPSVGIIRTATFQGFRFSWFASSNAAVFHCS